MTVNQIVVEVLNVVARSDPTPTETTSISATTSAIPASGGSTTSQSPLLFFVALGFGVVFTNLWYVNQ